MATLAVGIPAALAQSIVLNEIVSPNSAGITDEDGGHFDWIEIVNREATTVNLDGWGLSDDPGNPFRWTFGNLSLATGERLLVWASGKNRAGGDAGSGGVSATPPDEMPGLVT